MGLVVGDHWQAVNEGRGGDPHVVIPDMRALALEQARKARGDPCNPFVDFQDPKTAGVAVNLGLVLAAFRVLRPADSREIGNLPAVLGQEPLGPEHFWLPFLSGETNEQLAVVEPQEARSRREEERLRYASLTFAQSTSLPHSPDSTARSRSPVVPLAGGGVSWGRVEAVPQPRWIESG